MSDKPIEPLFHTARNDALLDEVERVKSKRDQYHEAIQGFMDDIHALELELAEARDTTEILRADVGLLRQRAEQAERERDDHQGVAAQAILRVEQARQREADLREALDEALSAVRAWHGLNLDEAVEPDTWAIYWHNAPELAKARAAKEECSIHGPAPCECPRCHLCGSDDVQAHCDDCSKPFCHEHGGCASGGWHGDVAMCDGCNK